MNNYKVFCPEEPEFFCISEFYFPGGQPPDAGSLSLAEALAAVSDYPYPPIDAGCVYTGQFVDWASDQGIPAVDIELTNHQDSDFEKNLAILSVFLDWSFSE